MLFAWMVVATIQWMQFSLPKTERLTALVQIDQLTWVRRTISHSKKWTRPISWTPLWTLATLRFTTHGTQATKIPLDPRFAWMLLMSSQDRFATSNCRCGVQTCSNRMEGSTSAARGLDLPPMFTRAVARWERHHGIATRCSIVVADSLQARPTRICT